MTEALEGSEVSLRNNGRARPPTRTDKSRMSGLPALARRHGIALMIGGLLLWLVVGPISLLFNMSIRDGTPANPGDPTLDNFAAITSSAHTWTATKNTFVYASLVTLVSLAIAALFAWLVERTDMPARKFAWVAMLAPVAVPGMLASMAWSLMLSPRIGVINVWIRGALSVVGIDIGDEGPINIYSMGGMVFIEGVRGANTLFLMLVGAFRLMDPRLEEAARISGASKSYMMRRVTLPLMLPALLAAGIYGFLGNLDDFDTPLLIGLQADIFLLPTLIYFQAYVGAAQNWGIASAYTVVFLALMALLVTWYYRSVIKKSRRYATVSGKGYRPQRMSIGRWRYFAVFGFIGYFLLAIALPFAIQLWASLLPHYRLPSREALSQLSFNNYIRVFTDPGIINATVNTIVLAVSTATITMVVAFTVSWAIVRIRVKGGMLMDALAFAPNAVPTVAIGLGIVIMYLHPALRWTGIYGSVTILTIALCTKYLAFSTRIGNSAMVQVASDLEEAAWVSGAGKFKTLTRIVAPLLLPTFIAGWLWIAASAFRNLTLPLLLASRRNEVLALRIYQYWTRDGDYPLTSTLGVMLIFGLVIVAIVSRGVIDKGFSGNQ